MHIDLHDTDYVNDYTMVMVFIHHKRLDQESGCRERLDPVDITPDPNPVKRCGGNFSAVLIAFCSTYFPTFVVGLRKKSKQKKKDFKICFSLVNDMLDSVFLAFFSKTCFFFLADMVYLFLT